MANTDMPDYKGIKKMCEALDALGEAYRDDWSEVDGRTIRSQMYTATEYIRRALDGEDISEYADELIEEWKTEY